MKRFVPLFFIILTSCRHPEQPQPAPPHSVEVGQLWQTTISDPFDEYGPIRTFRVVDLKLNSQGEMWVQYCWVERGCFSRLSAREEEFKIQNFLKVVTQ